MHLPLLFFFLMFFVYSLFLVVQLFTFLHLCQNILQLFLCAGLLFFLVIFSSGLVGSPVGRLLFLLFEELFLGFLLLTENICVEIGHHENEANLHIFRRLRNGGVAVIELFPLDRDDGWSAVLELWPLSLLGFNVVPSRQICIRLVRILAATYKHRARPSQHHVAPYVVLVPTDENEPLHESKAPNAFKDSAPLHEDSLAVTQLRHHLTTCASRRAYSCGN
mmetsp:Transcript_14332/g.39036  ORF Transcript_14332/g.39036 Transcript_14332/m.39036 type:complete len:221 (+) Transcript_14332:4957-5619(+)